MTTWTDVLQLLALFGGIGLIISFVLVSFAWANRRW